MTRPDMVPWNKPNTTNDKAKHGALKQAKLNKWQNKTWSPEASLTQQITKQNMESWNKSNSINEETKHEALKQAELNKW